MAKIYNKLVRDLIPEIIRQSGEKPKTRVLESEEFRRELVKKLFEECAEIEKAVAEPKELIKEIGDVLEILEAIQKEWGLSQEEVGRLKEERKKSRGGFDKKIFLEKTE